MKTRSFCETPMSLVMSNSKDGQGHSDKYLAIFRKVIVLKKKWFKLFG